MDAILSKRIIAGLDEFDVCTCLNLRKATRAVTQFYEGLLDPTGLKITQLPILAQAATLGPVTMTKLSDSLVMDRTTLTRNLQPLVRLGFVKVRAGEDRRARLVSATPEGLDALEAALPLWRKAQAEMLEHLGRFSWGVLMDNLRATIDAARNAGR